LEHTPDDGLPITRSLSSRAIFAEITAENPYLDASSQATLYKASALLASADATDAHIEADGLLILGSRGQPVAHVLIGEARMARVQALAALRSFGLETGQWPPSAAGSALVSKRWHGARSRWFPVLRPAALPLASLSPLDLAAKTCPFGRLSTRSAGERHCSDS
jgi:hypothetical protein